MKKITRKQIMKAAWIIAKRAAKRFADSPRKFLSESLKIAWAEAKKIMSQKYVNVPRWFISKKTYMGYASMRGSEKMHVIKETEKAVLVEDEDDRTGQFTFWCPKSILN